MVVLGCPQVYASYKLSRHLANAAKVGNVRGRSRFLEQHEAERSFVAFNLINCAALQPPDMKRGVAWQLAYRSSPTIVASLNPSIYHVGCMHSLEQEQLLNSELLCNLNCLQWCLVEL